MNFTNHVSLSLEIVIKNLYVLCSLYLLSAFIVILHPNSMYSGVEKSNIFFVLVGAGKYFNVSLYYLQGDFIPSLHPPLLLGVPPNPLFALMIVTCPLIWLIFFSFFLFFPPFFSLSSFFVLFFWPMSIYEKFARGKVTDLKFFVSFFYTQNIYNVNLY